MIFDYNKSWKLMIDKKITDEQTLINFSIIENDLLYFHNTKYTEDMENNN